MKNLILIFAFSFSLLGNAQIDVKSSSKKVVEVLTEFSEAAEHYQVDYQPKLKELKMVLLVDSGKDFVSQYKDGVLYLNSRLEAYPELLRVHIYQALGKIYGLKYSTGSNRDFMSKVWFEFTPRNEMYAMHIKERGFYLKSYFGSIKEKNKIIYKHI